jgi:hypothetical protein
MVAGSASPFASGALVSSTIRVHRIPRLAFVTIAKCPGVALALTVLAFITYIAMPPAVIKQATALLGRG